MDSLITGCISISFGGFTLSDTDFVSPILDGIISYVYELIMEAFSFIIGYLTEYTDLYSPVSTLFYDFIGAGSDTYNNPMFDVFITMAIFLLLGTFIVNLIILGIPTTEHKNSLLNLILGFFGALITIYAIKPFLWLINQTVNTFMFQPLSTYFSEDMWNDIEISEIIPDVGQHVGMTLYGLILIIIVFAIILEYIKMILTVIERYCVAGLLHVASPMAGSMICSQTTISVFNNYMRMYLSQEFLLVMNEFFIYLSVIVVFHSLGSILNCLFAITFLRCAQQIDRYLKSLGLSVAQTGGSLLTSMLVAGMSMGRLVAGGKRGLMQAGNIAENIGASSGNFALANVGTSLKNLVQPTQPGARTASSVDALNNFSQKGGLGNLTSSSGSYDGVLGAATKAFSNGQYNAVSNLTADLQTDTIKNSMGANCAEAFKNATGINVSDINSATVKSDGTIQGTAEVADADGNLSTVGFTMGANAIPGSNATSISGFSDGQNRYVSTSKVGNIAEGTTFDVNYGSLSGGTSVTSTVTGATINSQAMASAGVTKDVISQGTITHYRGDEVVGMTNISSGKYFTCGDQGNIHDLRSSYNTASNEGSLSSTYGGYIPNGATSDWSKSTRYNNLDDSVDIRWQRGGKEGITHISRPSSSDIAYGSKSKIYNSGSMMGDYSVKHEYLKEQTVKSYHS